MLFLYGIAGTGKIFISRYLAAHLDYPLHEANRLREPSIPAAPLEESGPFRYQEVGYAWQKFGKLTRHNAIAGLHATRRSMQPILKTLLVTHENGIFEGDYLDPEVVCTHGQVVLITNLNETNHRRQFFQYRQRSPAEEANFVACRYIQPYLIQEAQRYPVTIMDCEGSPGKIIQTLTGHTPPPMLH